MFTIFDGDAQIFIRGVTSIGVAYFPVERAHVGVFNFFADGFFAIVKGTLEFAHHWST